MTRETEAYSGGLRNTLRTLALNASVDEFWLEPAAQSVSLRRRVDIPGEENTQLTVSFEAAKRYIREDLSEKSLRTFYSIEAREVTNDVDFGDIPEAARQEARLMSKKVSSEETILSIEGSDDDSRSDQITEDEDESADLLYDTVQSVRYNLDGRAVLRSIQRAHRVLSIDEDDYEEELYEDEYIELANPLQEHAPTLSLNAWQQLDSPRAPFELAEHPQLRKLELEANQKSLKQDLSFLEMIKGYAHSRELIVASRRQHAGEVMALIAFLQCQGSVQSVRNLI